MKRIFILLLTYGYLGTTLFAQTTSQNSNLLTTVTWKIKEDKMSGIGQHVALAKNTEIKFNKDGSWESTQPIQQVKKGGWELSKDASILLIKFGASAKTQKSKITELSAKKLSYEVSVLTKTSAYSWEAK